MGFLMHLSTRKTSFTRRTRTLNKLIHLHSAWEKERGRGETKQVDGTGRQKEDKNFLLSFPPREQTASSLNGMEESEIPILVLLSVFLLKITVVLKCNSLDQVMDL